MDCILCGLVRKLRQRGAHQEAGEINALQMAYTIHVRRLAEQEQTIAALRARVGELERRLQ